MKALPALRDPLTLPRPRATINTPRVVSTAAHIERLHHLTHDTLEVVVACAPSSAPLRPRAGQFATLTVEGIARPRAYSFARDPAAEAPGEHTFFIRLVPGGEMSEWLRAGDRCGAALTISGPLGVFALDDGDWPMLFVAGGSGMSAVKALLEQACRQQLARDAVLLYGARTRADRYAGDAMASIAAAWHPRHRFEFVEVLSEEPPNSDWCGARGLVTDVLHEQYFAQSRFAPGAMAAWLCGPPPMIAAAERVLEIAGVAPARVRRDVFEDARSPAPVIDNRRCVLCDECLLVKPVADCIVETGSVTTDDNGCMTAFSAVAPGRSAGLYYNALVIDAGACIRCYACVGACPHGAISSTFAPHPVTLRHSAG